MYQYPYGNAQQLNLDWILNQIKEIVTSAQGLALQEVANSIITASYDADNTYRRFDYTFYNNKLYRAENDTTGVFNPADWREVLLADDIPVLTRLINSIDASLTTVQNIVNANLKYVLQSTGDDTDRYADIMYCLNNYGVCILGDGVFYISSTIGMPDGSTFTGLGLGSVLQLKDSAAGTVAVNVGSYCLLKDMTIKGNSTELPYSSYTQGTRKGVALLGDYTSFGTGTWSHNFAKLSNLTITDFNHSGIWAYQNDGAASFLADNIDILRCHTGINIEFFSEFHSFTNVRCRHCNVAVMMNGGNNLFSNCHFDVNLMNMTCEDADDSLVNAAHSTFTGCTFCHADNNTGHNVWVKGTANGWIFTSCQFWYGIVRFEDATGVLFADNIIGGTTNTIIFSRCNTVSFINNMFKTQSPTINLSSTTNLIWENNIDYDGSIIVQSSNIGQAYETFKLARKNYRLLNANEVFTTYNSNYVFAVEAARNNNCVAIYLRLTSSTPNNVSVGTLAQLLRPLTNWAMLTLFANTGSNTYVPVGSVWIQNNGTVYVYKNTNIAADDVYYCFGTYVAVQDLIQ